MRLLFPVVASFLAVFFVVVKLQGARPPQYQNFSTFKKAVLIVLVTHLASSLLFGLYLAVKVLCCSSDPAWWLMPLLLAPLEYWAKFGLTIVLPTALLGVLAIRWKHPK